MKFELKVAQGSTVNSLNLEASTLEQACLLAQSQGLSVLTIKPAGFQLPVLKGAARKPKFNLSLFSQELLALLQSGLSLVESIEALAEKESNAESKSILNQLKAALYEGQPLSSALERVPSVFNALYIALIRASERTGDMIHALGRHVTYQAQVDAVRKKIVAASIYPVLLIVVGGLVVMFLLGYVVPKFSTIYESTGADLPWMSQLLLEWGRLVHERGSQVFMGFMIVLSLIFLVFTRPGVRAYLWSQLWKIPALGNVMHIYQLARFYRTLGMLLRGGIPLMTAMEMVASLLQMSLRNRLQKTIDEVREGKVMSASLENYGLTTPISIRMLRVGERTGQMGEMMERIGEFYDDEIARAVEWLTKLLEPILMIVIGLIVGLVVVLMYMPIFELAGSMQ
jgi:general secretion pathway protein F